MSSEPQGINIELAGVAQVAGFLVAILAGFYWVSTAKNQPSMLQRGSLVGAGLLATAVTAGLLQRKP